MFIRLVMVLFLALMPVSRAFALEVATPVGGSTSLEETSGAQADGPGSLGDSENNEDVSDPLEPFNRAMFVINDFIYSYVVKPLSHVYAAVTPEIFRTAIKNFFHNLSMPKHLVNAFLQGKPDVAGRELFRFVINTTVGVLGFYDAAEQMFDMKPGNEDAGQTLGAYGIGDGVYINWPIFGPSNIRDSFGLVGDTLLNPLSYVPSDMWARTGIRGFQNVNSNSLKLGEYESLKEAALDPYTAVRDAYLQTRRKQIRE
ncbi:MAG: mlaA [Magnetococcales bacterium]|nr:mlaA [Magnetococcales bacterium]HIJ82656.1 VacJ family lipoprotein [Magnetococcales bacterium]